MKELRNIAIAATMIVSTMTGPAFAQGIPVYDNANTLQSIQQVANQLRELEEMARDYAMQADQYVELFEQTKALTGARDLGSLLNGTIEFEGRRYLPEDIEGLLNLGSSTIGSVSAASGIYNDLRDKFDPASGAVLNPNDPSGTLAESTDRLTNTTYGILAASEQAYNTINKRTENVEAMLTRLNASTDLKDSSDLTARIAAENALILNERLRLQTLEMQLAATIQNEELMRLKQANEMNQYDPAAAAASVK